MSKFCNKCGTELVDGKCPKCDKEEEKIEKVEEAKTEVKEETREEASEVGKKVAEYLKLFFNTAKGMFKNPEKTLKEKNIGWEVASIVMVINSILFGFVVKVMLEKMLSGAAFTVLANVSNSLAGIFGQKLTSIGDISKTAGIGFAVNSVIIAIVIWAMHEIVYRKKLNVFTVIVMEGKCQCLFTLELLITIVVAYISVGLAVFLLPIFVISCLINIHCGFITISKIKEDQVVYVTTLGNLFPVISITMISGAMILLQLSTSGINSIL